MKRYIGLIVILVVFTIGYFVGSFSISKYFDVDFEEEMYEQKISAIETQTVIYATYTEGLFDDGNSVYVTISELAENNVIISDENGDVVDPRDDGSTLNDLKVKITNNDGKISAVVLS